MKYTAAAGGAAGPAGVPEPLPLGAGTGDHVGGAPRAPSGGVVPKDVADTQHGLRYEVLDRPPLPQAILLGFQQYLVMLGSTVLIPSLVVPPMGATKEELARVICTIFFASGLVTLLQTFLGDRLPIVQGGSFAYISPALAVTAHVKATMQFASEHERFHYSMRVVSGGIIGSGLIVFGIGALGIIRPVLRAISPITVAVNIAVLSLSLTAAGFPGVMGCPHLGFTTIALVVLFSQYLRRFAIPLGRGRRWHVFELCPVILGLGISWFVAWVLTISNAYKNASPEFQAACRTDQSTALRDSPWFRVPYPGQWGAPILESYSTLTFLAGALPAMIESLGDYYACSQIAGAPVPPPDVISRAVAWQGLSCVITGLFGTSSGTTAYNENIGAILVTRVGSRFVVQIGAVCMMLVAMLGKFGGLFASLPSPLISGLFCIVFGLIAAVGLGMMEHADQRSQRNVFIVGFGLYMGLSVSQYFGEYPKTHGGQGPIATGSAVADNVLNSIFSTAAAVSLIITVILDNTIPGTDAERGLTSWLQPHLAANGAAGASGAGAGGGGGGAGGAAAAGDGWWWEDERMNAVYGLPFDLTRRWEAAAGARLRAWRARALAGARRALACGGRCRGRGGGGGGGGGGSGGSPAAAEVGAGGSAVALTVRAAGGADGSGAAVGGDFAAVAGSAAARRGAGERV